MLVGLGDHDLPSIPFLTFADESLIIRMRRVDMEVDWEHVFLAMFIYG
jgi:hypothetical protein